MIKRLYLHIYLMVVGSLVLFALLAGLVWRHIADSPSPGRPFEVVTELAYAALPPADATPAAQQAALLRIGKRIHADLALFAEDGARLAQVGMQLPDIEPGRKGPGWLNNFNGGHMWALALPDGRRLVARLSREHRHPAMQLFLTLGIIALAVAVFAYPVARRLTRRLERLQASVEALGAGALGTRVKIEGNDEVSSLAQSFNRAAQRIEQLVSAHKKLLANASHELRSPLARLRMGIEMLKGDTNARLRAEFERDIAELDGLIDEILLASRLDTIAEREAEERLDFLALVAEECARTGAVLTGDPVTLLGDARLLRRLVRNLLENARRYGNAQLTEVTVGTGKAGRVRLDVCDRGPGVAEAERERIFEPFYRPAGAGEREGSVGLGLSLVRQIARRHGGNVQCLPREGGGTCFHVELVAQA